MLIILATLVNEIEQMFRNLTTNNYKASQRCCKCTSCKCTSSLNLHFDTAKISIRHFYPINPNTPSHPKHEKFTSEKIATSHYIFSYRPTNCMIDLFIWVFPKIGGKPPQNGWFISWKTLLKWMIWGAHPYFWKHSYNEFNLIRFAIQ